ncbi:MAG TPA: hypothetical protein VI365_14005 [Trebonia sp.]
MTVADAASALRLSKDTVDRVIKAGKIGTERGLERACGDGEVRDDLPPRRGRRGPARLARHRADRPRRIAVVSG